MIIPKSVGHITFEKIDLSHTHYFLEISKILMKCEWLKNESNYFVTCKYFRLILQPLQTVTNVN